MARRYTFDKKSVEKIASTVRGFASLPLGGAQLVRQHKSRSGSSSGSFEYSGPFAVIDSSSSGTVQVTVCGANSTEGRNFTSQIILGLTVKTFAEANLSISASGYVYLKITYSSSDYVVELKTAAALPAQTATEYYIPLAWVDYADSAISGITQFQFGQIQAAGRIV